MSKFIRVADRAAMVATLSSLKADGFKFDAIATNDATKTAKRPQIIAFKEKQTINVLFNEMAEGVSYYGRRAAVEARNFALSIISEIEPAAADTALNRIARVKAEMRELAAYEATIEAKPAAAAECAPCTWSELTEYEKSEANFRGFPRGADIRYVTLRKYDQEAGEMSLVKWTRHFDKPAAAQPEKPVRYAVAANSLNDDFVSEWFDNRSDAVACLKVKGEDTHYIMDTESLEESRNTSQRARDLLALAFPVAETKPAAVDQGADLSAALLQVEALQEEAATLATLDSVWLAIMETLKTLDIALDDVETWRTEGEKSGSRLNVLFRMTRVYRRSDQAAGSFNFIGVGRISFAQGRLAVFKRRALRLVAHRLAA